MPKPIDGLLELLKDGQWRYEGEIYLSFVGKIAPEEAIQVARKITKRKPSSHEPALAVLLRQGIRHIVQPALGKLKKQKRAEDRMLDGKRQWRLIDEEYIAWAKAATENIK